MTQEKILQYLKAEKTHYEKARNAVTYYVNVVEIVIKLNYINKLIELIEEYDDNQLVKGAVDAVINLAEEDND